MHKPKTYNKAFNNLVKKNKLQKTINKEFWKLDSQQTWYFITLQPNCKLIYCKWVFKIKYHSDRSIERYKAKFIVQDFLQVYNINYTETFVPILRRKSLKIFLELATMVGMTLLQINVISAYPDSSFGQNNHHIYMKIPQKCGNRQEKLLCKI